MSENTEIIEAAKPSAEEINTTENNEATTPLDRQEITIPIKFNKEIKNISADEAAILAQKGMKYDLISEDYKMLKCLSQKNGKSVTEFLEDLKVNGYNQRVKELTEKCGGDETLAQHIIDLENNGKEEAFNGFGELQRYFPKFKSPEELPEEIREASSLKGTLLLDEYLRYLLNEKRSTDEAVRTSEFGEKASVGSQLNRKGAVSPEASEFLKGLWR